MAVEALELLEHVPDGEENGGGGFLNGLVKKFSSKKTVALEKDDGVERGPLLLKGISFASHSVNQAERERTARVLAKEVLDALKTAPVPA